MRKILYLIAIMAATITAVSCEDFLEKNPVGEPTSQNFWKSAGDAERAADGLYFWSAYEGITGRGVMWYINASDDMITGRTKGYADNIKNFIADNNSDAKDNWPTMYQLIKRCNDIIANVPGMDIDDETKDRVLGQAYFFRGWAYLWLAPHYGDNGDNGGIPIVTESTPVEDIDQPRPSTVSANYEFCISDFGRAASMLSYFDELNNDQYGRPHKTACWAYAAKAALYNAQYKQDYYDTVIVYTNKIIGSGKHRLLDDFADVFKMTNNWSKEYIWSWTSNESDGSKFPGVVLDNKGWGLYNGWGYFMPTLELAQEFEEGDSRRAATLFMPGDEIEYLGNKWIYGVDKANESFSNMMFRKYFDPFVSADAIGKYVNPNGDNMTTDLNIPMVRYSEVLLWKAEAQIWKGLNGDSALNAVRTRAGLGALANATKSDLKHERRCELAGEHANRHFDLVRWGDAQTTYAKPLHGLKRVTDGNGNYLRTDAVQVWPARSFDPSINHVWPIPDNEVANSKNLKQNKGY
ncbi:MAG: RagB/SusD family nutrient uptake outer membrane protein [Breznakibacter sp.]